ncbi:MAG TPA: Yip1 family protein [Bacillota bacterium]|nr:Yip1 family protein [Bacillota bacterium]
MECSKCGSYQDSGKFCGTCGGELVASTKQADDVAKPESEQTESEDSLDLEVKKETLVVDTPETEGEANESVEKVKEASRAYGSFFTTYIKSPSDVFSHASKEFTNALINIGIIALLLAFTNYRTISNVMSEFYFDEFGPSFFSIFFNVVLGFAIVTAIIISILFVVNKLFGTMASYKDIVSIFGVHMTVVVITIGLAFILSIFKANTYALILVFVAMALMFTLIPLYIISHLLTKEPKNIDPLYGYLIYIVGVSITFVIVIGVLLDSTLGNFINDTMTYM